MTLPVLLAWIASSATPLPEAQALLLDRWYAAVGERRADEGFGALIARAGLVQLGTPYLDRPQEDAPETLIIELDTLQCLSLVESTVALARCTWLGTRDADCFQREVQRLRYRDGTVNGYASRLHYFADWAQNNVARGHVAELTREAGGASTRVPMDFMTRHPHRYPALVHTEVRDAIRAIETRLSSSELAVVDKRAVTQAQPTIEPGDILAFITSKPGLFVSHTALAVDTANGKDRVLHASSYHKKVIVTPGDVASYVNRRADRLGIMILRPIPPAAAGVPTAP